MRIALFVGLLAGCSRLPLAINPPSVTFSSQRDADGAHSRLSVSRANAPADGVTPITVSVLVADAEGQIVSDAAVTLQASGAATGKHEATTGADGQAALSVTATMGGDVTFTATVAGVELTAKAAFVAADGVAGLRFIALPEAVGLEEPFDVTVVLLDADNNVIARPGNVTLSISRTNLIPSAVRTSVLGLSGTVTSKSDSGTASFSGLNVRSAVAGYTGGIFALRAEWNGFSVESPMLWAELFRLQRKGISGSDNLRVFVDMSTNPSSLWLTSKGVRMWAGADAQHLEVVNPTFMRSPYGTPPADDVSGASLATASAPGQRFLLHNATLRHASPAAFGPALRAPSGPALASVSAVAFDKTAAGMPMLVSASVSNANYIVDYSSPDRPKTLGPPMSLHAVALAAYTASGKRTLLTVDANYTDIASWTEGDPAWTTLGVPAGSGSPKHIFVDKSTSPMTLISVTDGGVFTKPIDATTWTPVALPFTGTWSFLDVKYDDAHHTLYMYIERNAVNRYELWMTNDLGTTITRADTGITGLTGAARMAIDERSGRLYMTNYWVLWTRDHDSGAWSRATLNLNTSIIDRVFGSITAPKQLLAIDVFNGPAASSDGGDSWTLLPADGLPLNSTTSGAEKPYAGAVDASTDPPTYYVGFTAQGLYVLQPHATAWTNDANLGGGCSLLLVDDTTSPAEIFSVSPSSSIVSTRSASSNTWAQSAALGGGISALRLDTRGANKTLYLATNTGVRKIAVADLATGPDTLLGAAQNRTLLTLELSGSAPAVVWSGITTQVFRLVDDGSAEADVTPPGTHSWLWLSWQRSTGNVYLFENTSVAYRRPSDTDWRSRGTRFLIGFTVDVGESMIGVSGVGLASFKGEVLP